MKTNNLFAALLLSFGLMSVVVSYEATAAPDPKKIEARKKKKSQALGQSVGKKVQKAFELYSNDQLNEALVILEGIKAKKEFDKAYLSRFIGNIYAGVEGKTKVAINYLDKAIKPDILSFNDHAQAMQLIAQLYYQEKQYDKAIAGYQAWMDFTGKEDATVYVAIANSYFEKKQYAKVIAPADKAISLYKKPNQNPYILKMGAFYESKKYPQAIKVVETLVENFPNEKRWWVQLGMLHMLVENYTKALEILDLAYKQGFLEKSNEISALASLYGSSGIPVKSAQLQEKYMKSGLLKSDKSTLKSVANAYHLAKNLDKAIYYFGMAADKDSDAKLYRKQASLLAERERYDESIKVYQKALKSGFKDKHQIYMRITEAYFYQGKFKEAYKYVKMAMEGKSTRRTAKGWKKYIEEKASNRKIKLS
ncbi:tetratricopeptide repeat protein [Algicola sagamiensis]|uniref:tetratricopeptide repeat protein n=1 Tax=Algicola sagamiensis TaxID=163869 RepID=UPI000366165D|nr:tetratricopeptide repeat protein [Algicola sagamiensis]